jgi:thiamine-monophosphate kinase
MALVERVALHALIDVSDGLSTDALHLAEASGVGLRIDEEAIPVSADARELAQQTGRSPLWHALNDGEDYELLFCLPAPEAEELAEEGLGDLPVSTVGEVTAGPGSELIGADGQSRELKPSGWEHLTE